MSEDATQSDEEVLLPGQDGTTEIDTAESSTASEEKHEVKPNGVQNRIDDLTRRRYEAERRADDLERQLADKGSEKPVTAGEEIAPPSLPEDPYDQEAMEEYHRGMVKYSKEVATEAGKNAYDSQRKETQETKRQDDRKKVVSNYADNAMRDGVDLDKLRVAEKALNEAGISPELGSYIMSDPNGGKIAEYLYENPAAMHDVMSLDPVSAGIKIASEIKPLAISTAKKVSTAPDPIPDIKGGGTLEKDDFSRDFPGTTFI